MADLKDRTPQLEHGHTRVANELLLALAKHCKGRQLCLLAVVMRFSYGFQKKKALLTVRELSNHLGMDRPNTRRIIKQLEARNMLVVLDWPGHHRKAYLVQKDWRAWDKPTGATPQPRKAKKSGPVRLVKEGGEFKAVMESKK